MNALSIFLLAETHRHPCLRPRYACIPALGSPGAASQAGCVRSTTESSTRRQSQPPTADRLPNGAFQCAQAESSTACPLVPEACLTGCAFRNDFRSSSCSVTRFRNACPFLLPAELRRAVMSRPVLGSSYRYTSCVSGSAERICTLANCAPRPGVPGGAVRWAGRRIGWDVSNRVGRKFIYTVETDGRCPRCWRVFVGVIDGCLFFSGQLPRNWRSIR